MLKISDYNKAREELLELATSIGYTKLDYNIELKLDKHVKIKAIRKCHKCLEVSPVGQYMYTGRTIENSRIKRFYLCNRCVYKLYSNFREDYRELNEVDFKYSNIEVEEW